MLRLNLQKQPYWINIEQGIRLKVKPLSTAIMSCGQAYVRKQIQSIREERKSLVEIGEDISHLPDIQNEEVRSGLVEALFSKGLALQAILEWEGILMPQEDVLAPITPETVSDLMDIWFVAEKFTKEYIDSLSLLEKEGNVSKLAVNGTSAVELNTVEDAIIKTCPVVEEKTAH